MRHELKQLPEAQIEVFVELDHSELEPHLRRAAEELSTEHAIEGFRPGKAPLDVVKKHFGDIKVYERALTHAVNATVPRLIAEEKLRIVGHPEFSVRKLAPGNPVEFVMKAHIIPEFPLPDIETIAKKILKKKENPKVSESEVDEAVKWIREERSELKKTDRAATKGDAVEIDFTAKNDGVVIGNESKNHPLIIGRGSMVEGFEDKLIGMKDGDEKEFSLKVSDSHADKAIAGKTLDFAVKMALVQERILPEADNVFAQSVGKFESLDSLKDSIRDGIRKEKTEKEKDRIRVAIADAIAKETEFPLPQPLIENELEKMIGELKLQIESMGMNFENYLSHLKKTEDGLKEEWKEDAKRRVKVALILRKISEEKNIRPTEEETGEEAKKVLARFKTPGEAEKQIDPEALENYARGVVRNEKVFQYLEGLDSD